MEKRKRYIVKTDKSPVWGYKCYSVFKNENLVFIIDGDKVSVFDNDGIECIVLPQYSQNKIYRIGEMLFTGYLPLTKEVFDGLPKDCKVYQA